MVQMMPSSGELLYLQGCLDTMRKIKEQIEEKKMTIKRYTTYFTTIIPDANGEYIMFVDYEQEVKELEYECRALKEAIEIEQDEVKYWKEKYFEMYEQSY